MTTPTDPKTDQKADQKADPERKRGRPVKLLLCIDCKVEKRTTDFPPQKPAGTKSCCRDCLKLRKKTPDDAFDRRVARLRGTPALLAFKQEFEERKRCRDAMDQTTEFFKGFAIVRCECCYSRPATGQDSIGFRHWCSGCGWGVERTGRCLAHPGETYYPGLPTEGITLPPEYLAEMCPPPPPSHVNEAPPTEPDEDP